MYAFQAKIEKYSEKRKCYSYREISCFNDHQNSLNMITVDMRSHFSNKCEILESSSSSIADFEVCRSQEKFVGFSVQLTPGFNLTMCVFLNRSKKLDSFSSDGKISRC